MSIVIIGGNCGMHRVYKDICKERGIDAKVYTRLPAQFTKNIGNPDAVLFFTGTVSHKMVVTAKNEIKKRKIKMIQCHSSSAISLRTSLDSLNTVE